MDPMDGWVLVLSDKFQPFVRETLRKKIFELTGSRIKLNDAKQLLSNLRAAGVEVIPTETIDMLGKFGNCCVSSETGKRCSFCECGDKFKEG